MCRYTLYIYRGVFMSNFSVNGVYTYTGANIYSYLGRLPRNDTVLKNAFREYGIIPKGKPSDLKRLENAMYREYTEQVKEQIDNQNAQKHDVPWAGLLAQIGIQATGDREKDFAAFNNAIQLLSQSAIDGQAMSYFAGLRSEAQRVFASYSPADTQVQSFYQYKADQLS